MLILALNHIITEDPLDQKAQRLLRLIGTMENIEDPRIRVAEGMSLVEYKLHKALQYFYDSKYAKVIEETNDVLVIDPTNAKAYKRMGSAFYSIGNEEKAVEAWKKSLQLNPADTNLRDFINRIIGRTEDQDETLLESIIE